jgi:hypothetical protein
MRWRTVVALAALLASAGASCKRAQYWVRRGHWQCWVATWDRHRIVESEL